jgi:cytochrome bd-type quinol oxidase subunit 2
VEFLVLLMPTVWFGILALFLLLYVILDGFDLGWASSRSPASEKSSAQSL